MATITTLPMRRDVVIYQGATFRQHWRWKPGGVAIDLTGWTGRMQVRATKQASEPLLSLTTENDGITLTATGDIKLFATDEQTAALPQSGVYDVELEAPDDGDVYRFAEGRATLSLEVTR